MEATPKGHVEINISTPVQGLEVLQSNAATTGVQTLLLLLPRNHWDTRPDIWPGLPIQTWCRMALLRL